MAVQFINGFGFAHRLFHTVRNSAPALRSAGRWLFKTGTEGAVQAIAQAGIGLVVDRVSDFTNRTPEQIRELSSTALASAIGINCPGINDDQVSRDHNAIVQTILDALADNDDGPQAVAERFDNLRDEFSHVAGLGPAIQSGGEIVGCALGELAADNDIVARGAFPEGMAPTNFIRRCNRRSSDGTRVSKEPHEYRYCRDSGQIGRVLNEARMQLERVREFFDVGDGELSSQDQNAFALYSELANSGSGEPFQGLSFDQADYTFGNFVDMLPLRDAIARSRKVRRIVRSKNSKEILSLVGLTREELIQNLVDNLDYSDLLRSVLAQSVLENSGQVGDVERQTDNVVTTVN